MRKASGKRLPHGATTAMVLDALMRLHTKDGRRVAVSRGALLASLRLPESTVDDRLRVLVKSRRILKVRQGYYEPMPLPDEWRLHPQPPGSQQLTFDAAGRLIEVIWK